MDDVSKTAIPETPMPNNNSTDYSVIGATEKTRPEDHVFCSTCDRDVPVSEAVVPEAVDYMVYFCGLECYERWTAQANSR